MKISREFKYICGLFLTTRIILTIIGVVSRILLDPFHGKEYVWVYSKHLWLDIWGVWDSGWYLGIAQNWYPRNVSLAVESNYGFFPLYPLLMKTVGVLTRNYYIAGILVSNVALLVACFFLYKLVKLDSDEETALRAVKYLFLFPTSFIFSGVFSESLYLMLILSSLYCARKGNWLLAGVSGFFLSLTRAYGVLILVPLLYEYSKNINYNLRKLRTNVLFLALVPFGLFLFFFYCHYLTGDWFAYIHNKIDAWGQGGCHNPFKNFMDAFVSKNICCVCPALFVAVVFFVLILSLRFMRFSYWLYGFYSVCLPLFSMDTHIFEHMLRYLLPVFPLYLILTKLSNSLAKDEMVTIALGLLQGFLMVFWSNGFRLII